MSVLLPESIRPPTGNIIVDQPNRSRSGLVGVESRRTATATLRRMDASKIELGTVFRFPHDDRPHRVLLYDGDVVMYDVWGRI
ncbi:hypothetical protein [Mycobacterium genavense]|uniref:hypothetical protein n=1 Tax=Mycobacterium genavense TaxID=36812 RepID=UPI00146FAD7C|nr:hypothetical protein [Mycobacterium genavense]